MNGLLLLSMQVWRGLWAPPGHERAAGVWGGSSPAGCPAAVAPEARRWLEQTAGDVGEQERCSGPGSHFPSVPARCQTGRVLPQQPGETMTMTLGLSVLKPWFRYGQHQVTCHCCVDDDTLNTDYLTTFHHRMTVFLCQWCIPSNWEQAFFFCSNPVASYKSAWLKHLNSFFIHTREAKCQMNTAAVCNMHDVLLCCSFTF